MRRSNTVMMASLAAGLTHLSSFVHLNDGDSLYTWAVLTQNGDGTFQVDERYNNPCYGEMRPYAKPKKGHGDRYKDYWEPNLLPESQRKVGKPTDLFWPFPKGTPLALAVPIPFNKGMNHNIDKWNAFYGDFVFSKEHSPWRKALKNFELICNEHGRISGIIILDTEIDPTIMVHMFRTIANQWYYGIMPDYEPFIKLGATYSEACLLSIILQAGAKNSYHLNYYPFGDAANNMHMLVTGEAASLTDGGTFKQRYAYNRPKQDYLFHGDSDKEKIAGLVGRDGRHLVIYENELPIIIEYLRSLTQTEAIAA